MAEVSHSTVLLRVGFGAACVGVVASFFVIATLQAAYSPLALALPAGPFEQLETEAFRLAAASFFLAWLWPRLGDGSHERRFGALLATGAFTKLGLLAFAASQGMMAMQAIDPRPLPPRLFLVRMFANALLLAAFAWAATRALRPPRRAASE